MTDLEERAGAHWARRLTRVGIVGLALVLALVAGAEVWTQVASSGHIHSPERAPAAPVAIVFGAQLAPDGTEPTVFLAGRLDVAAQLVATGRARVVLVSGDAHGQSGDETQAMTGYLIRHGVPARRIVADPYGLDSYDTCARAGRVYGVRHALLVTQSYHLPRAVTLCRRLGLDAEGVKARCDGCHLFNLAFNAAREALADVKAIGDAARRRPPQVNSPPDAAVANALRS